MQREEFIDYLVYERGLEMSTARTRAGNCATIENYEGDLDFHYRKDRLRNLWQRLQYSTQEHRSGQPAKHSIPINGNIYNGTATLRSALNLYIAFKNGDSAPAKREYAKRETKYHSHQKKRNAKDWPQWDQPGENDSLILAKMIARYTRFLAPEIIQAIVQNNEKHRNEWSEKLLARGIDAKLYLWNGSPCAFPGVRRHAGSKEINRLRDTNNNYSDIPDALCIDDNDYPKQIWSFVFRGSQFSKKGPDGYRLAHLIDHKEYKNRMGEELDCSLRNCPNSIPGLYTCVSNTAYVSGGLLLPTDFNMQIRNLIQRRAVQLYSPVCNLLPEGLSVKACDNPAWELDQFEWAPTVGTLANIDMFLEFRESRLEKLFK